MVDINGNDWYCGEEELEEVKEHPTEAEVSKEVETLEEAAYRQWKNVGFDKNDNPHNTYIAGAKFGANWQKEQERLLISELLDLLKYSRPLILPCDYLKGDDYLAFVDKIKLVVIKAENHLNNG